MLVQNVQMLVESIRNGDQLLAVRNHINAILDQVDIILAAAEGGIETPTSFQTLFGKEVEPAYHRLNQCKMQLEHALENSVQHEGKPSAKDFSQALPPLAFQTAREAKDLVAKADLVTIGEHGEGASEDFS